MKVYELAKGIADCKAGAEIKISDMICLADLTNCDTEEIDGVIYYHRITKLVEISNEGGTVYFCTE